MEIQLFTTAVSTVLTQLHVGTTMQALNAHRSMFKNCYKKNMAASLIAKEQTSYTINTRQGGLLIPLSVLIATTSFWQIQ